MSGRPVVSGAVHYFRILPQQWEQRLRMLRAMGANCVETYVPWNLHQRRPGETTGVADLAGFLDLAASLDLAAIVRPGPYICAEWENGGLPSWLRAEDRHAPLRCSDPGFLAAVDAWFGELIPVIAQRQVDRGGNVIAVQVENEYGSYGSDADYLRHLADGLVRLGITVPLFTSDGPTDAMLTAGSVDGLPTSVNFGSRPEEAFEVQRRRRPDDHPWCMEFWNGWFDHWGESHHVRDPADAADVLNRMLAAGANVNIYMAHGGTNFGTWAGANHEVGYQPTVTSYDYDAPIGESGGATAKFHAFREVIGRYLPVGDIPEPDPVLPTQRVELTESLPLLSVLPAAPTERFPSPPRFEELGLDQGLVVYRHRLRGPRQSEALTVAGVADRAQLFLDGEPLATLERDGADTVDLATVEDRDLSIVVESLGRVNFGPLLGESKGILDGVRHGRQTLHGWTAQPIGLDDIRWLPWETAAEEAAGPRFHRGRLTVETPADGFLALPGWRNGYVWVNGFCLGRYREAGPQATLYLPWPLLRAGDNEIVVLELDTTDATGIELRSEPDLGPVAASPQ
ncbi:beta-galactosidase [Stackebrandtia endophytica]|uniref:Beta-galactosidase n=1 Tax=Stackebrandtia endophytica TaxID=1496996 RepID=A0A543AYE1_9ACTN|nr:beta-galactosidase family protein [Stackebrandtia endophytica]TQL77540.1 beta-galactosidase [Stackebrandtia endophytica]